MTELTTMEELNNIRKVLDSYLGLVFKIGLLAVVFSAFFLFTNITTEFFDTPKFLVLLVFTGILLVILTLKYTVAGKVTFVRTPLDIPLLLLLAVGIVSTLLSPSPYVALLGNQLRIHGSLISLTAYVLFYFLLVNNLKHAKEVKWIFTLIVFASQVLAVITLLSYFGVNLLPQPWVGATFTPTGSSFSTTAILALLLPFIIMPILSSTKPLFLILNSLFLLITGVTIALTGTWATWIAALVGLSLCFFISDLRSLSNLNHLSRAKLISLIALITPIILTVAVIILSFLPPIGGTQNPLYTQAKNFPREIQLPFVSAWKVSVSAFRDLPIWGSGPSTYLFDFTNYKPVEFNTLKVWNLRFDTSFNEYLQVLANLGGIGILALLSLTALFISGAYNTIYRTMRLRNESYSELRTPSNEPRTMLAIAGIVFFIILALHVSSLGLWVIGIIILASFMIANLPDHSTSNWGTSSDLKNMFFRIATNVTSRNPSAETIRIDALPGVLLTIAIAIIAFTAFFGGKMVFADYHHRLALSAVSQNQGIAAYNELIAAEKLNPYNDSYRTDLAQVNFALANAIAAAKGPTEASPSGSLTDQDKQNIQVLLQQSITEGRTAVTLSPRSAINWEILALLYRQIAGVAQNALIFSLDSYGRAILQDPLNPQLRVSVGGVYYAVKNYDLATRFFTDSINLKPDYANAYYNLSVTLRDKGDLTNAQAVAEKLLTLLDANSQDYKTASDYLADLKNKIAEGSKQTTEQTEAQTVPPAAEANGALAKKELPKVINLPKPEKIATPAAIKASPTPSPVASEIPAESPTPEATP